MIKKYRNVFLAAAVAATLVSCGGGGNENPLGSGDPVTDLTGGDPVAKSKAALAIADLLAGGLLSVVSSTSSFFDTFAAITDPGTNMGKVLGAKSKTASGIASAKVEAKCTHKGDFALDIQLEVLLGTEKVTPALDDGFKPFADGPADIVVGMNFKACNEPKHTYNDNPADDIVDLNTNQIINGRMDVKLHSENNLTDTANKKDLQLSGTVTMKDFFIKSYEGSIEPTTLPDAVSGDIAVSLYTDNVDSNVFDTVLDVGITTSDKKADGTSNGVTRTAVKAGGELGLTDKFDIASYNLSIGGSIRNTGTEAPGSYTLFTVMPLIKSGGEGTYPQAGKIGLIDGDTKLKHYATVTADGLDFEITQADGSTKDGKCTWGQIEENTCDI